MRMQCTATAAVAVGSATGIRAWVATHRPHSLTAGRLKLATALLLGAGVLASGISVG